MPSSDGKIYCSQKAEQQLEGALLTNTDSLPQLDMANAQRDLKERFARMGEKKAYEYFIATYAGYGSTVHNLAHWVGEQLYKRLGLTGISVCDSSFVYGCYHGFLTAALYREGIQLLPKIESACRNVGSDPILMAGCLHGIGHGVVVNAGDYTVEHLISALSNCDMLTATISKTSCYNGAFMEYNNHTMESAQERTGPTTVRPFIAASPLHPCDELPNAYQSDCYYEQPSWWNLVLRGDFDAMGTYCGDLSDTNKQSCARGIGRVMGTKEQPVQQDGISVCSRFSGDIKMYCIIGAVEQRISEHDRNASLLCTGLSEADGIICLDRAKKVLCEITGNCQ